GKIDSAELEWLLELRAAYQKKAKAAGGEVNPNFEKLFHDAVAKSVLSAEGHISADKVGWLRSKLFGSKKVDESHKKLLGKLKKSIKHESAESNALHAEHQGEKKK